MNEVFTPNHSDYIDKIKKEFINEFGITVTPNDIKDKVPAYLLSKYWEDGVLGNIADWWLNKIEELIFQHNELLIKKIEEEYDKDEYCYQTCVVDIINLIKNSK
jgi:hypothetical protein